LVQATITCSCLLIQAHKSTLYLHPQLCLYESAQCNCKQCLQLHFFLGEMVHSSMCSAFQARCLLCSAGCPLTCSIWQIGGDTLSPLRAGRLVTAGFGTPFLPSLASSQQKSSLLLPINFPVGKNILGLPSECILLLISWLLPHTKINCASVGFLNKLQTRFFSRCPRSAHLPIYLPDCLQAEETVYHGWGWGHKINPFHLLHLLPYHPILLFGKEFFLLSNYSPD